MHCIIKYSFERMSDQGLMKWALGSQTTIARDLARGSARAGRLGLEREAKEVPGTGDDLEGELVLSVCHHPGGHP